MTSRLLDVDQVAELVQLSAFTIRRALRAGELPGCKLRGRWRVDPADVAAWIDASRHDPAVPENVRRLTATPRRRGTVPAGGIRQMVRQDRSAS